MATLQKNKFKVWIFTKVIKVMNWLAVLPNKLVPAPFRLIQISSAFWHSRALYVATQLQLAEMLHNGLHSTSALAKELSLHEDHLYRLMRMLASIGIFTETSAKYFINSSLSEYMRKDHPKSVRPMILMHNSNEMSRPWYESLEKSIHDGSIPFTETNDTELFTYIEKDQEFNELFSRAMDSVESLTGVEYLNDFNWSKFERVIDVGGSQGKKSIAILKENPQLNSLVYDKKEVVSNAENYWEQQGETEILNRINFLGGDMLKSIPKSINDKDIYFFMAVFHGMGDIESKDILNNLSQAMVEHNATAVIVDTVAEEMNIDPTIASMDMQMLMGTRGRERTKTEWYHLIKNTGFHITEIVNISTFAKFIVLNKDI